MKLLAGIFCLVLGANASFAEDTSPIFGSASQPAIIIKIDPATGQPIAILETPPVVLATTR